MNRKSIIDPADYINIFIILVIVLMFVGAPLVGISRVITTQQALNQECKTNYNFLQVALSVIILLVSAKSKINKSISND